MENLVLAAVLLAVLLKTVLYVESHMLHLQSLDFLVSLVWYLLLQWHGGVNEQDAVLAAHMLHLG